MRLHGLALSTAILTVLLGVATSAHAGSTHPWLESADTRDTLAKRVAPPAGFTRVAAKPGSFATWLRELPLKPAGSQVLLFDGEIKRNQDATHAVIEIDVGKKDLQQCADAVMRLRAEYLRAAGCASEIAFDFSSGDRARWSQWRQGQRPNVSGSKVSWVRLAEPDDSYRAFRGYLDSVFTYAGSASLEKELRKVEDPRRVAPGDVFIQGGYPGHAVIVVDVAQNAADERVFLIAQSYMPAQDIHVLTNPATPASPWYTARDAGVLETPEWIFSYRDLRRFPRLDCEGARSE